MSPEVLKRFGRSESDIKSAYARADKLKEIKEVLQQGARDYQAELEERTRGQKVLGVIPESFVYGGLVDPTNAIPIKVGWASKGVNWLGKLARGAIGGAVANAPISGAYMYGRDDLTTGEKVAGVAAGTGLGGILGSGGVLLGRAWNKLSGKAVDHLNDRRANTRGLPYYPPMEGAAQGAMPPSAAPPSTPPSSKTGDELVRDWFSPSTETAAPEVAPAPVTPAPASVEIRPALSEKVHELSVQGKSPEEIKSVVREELKKFPVTEKGRGNVAEAAKEALDFGRKREAPATPEVQAPRTAEQPITEAPQRAESVAVAADYNAGDKNAFLDKHKPEFFAVENVKERYHFPNREPIYQDNSNGYLMAVKQGDGTYAVTPKLNFIYNDTYHGVHALGKVFGVKDFGGGVFDKVEVVKPAIFKKGGGKWSLVEEGRLRLSQKGGGAVVEPTPVNKEPPAPKAPYEGTNSLLNKTLNEAEKEEARTFLTSKPDISVQKGIINISEGETAFKAAGRWISENVKAPIKRGDIGEVVLNEGSVKDSFGHGFSEAKFNAVPTLPDVIRNGKLLGIYDDLDGKAIKNAFIAAPVDIGGDVNVVLIRLRNIKGHERNKFYVHEVFTLDEIKSDAAFKGVLGGYDPGVAPSGTARGIPLYRNILQDIFGVKPLDVNAIKPHSPSTVVQRAAEAKAASSAIPTGVKETVQRAKGKAGRPSKSVTEALITPDTPAERQAKIDDAITRIMAGGNEDSIIKGFTKEELTQISRGMDKRAEEIDRAVRQIAEGEEYDLKGFTKKEVDNIKKEVKEIIEAKSAVEAKKEKVLADKATEAKTSEPYKELSQRERAHLEEEASELETKIVHLERQIDNARIEDNINPLKAELEKLEARYEKVTDLLDNSPDNIVEYGVGINPIKAFRNLYDDLVGEKGIPPTTATPTHFNVLNDNKPKAPSISKPPSISTLPTSISEHFENFVSTAKQELAEEVDNHINELVKKGEITEETAAHFRERFRKNPLQGFKLGSNSDLSLRDTWKGRYETIKNSDVAHWLFNTRLSHDTKRVLRNLQSRLNRSASDVEVMQRAMLAFDEQTRGNLHNALVQDPHAPLTAEQRTFVNNIVKTIDYNINELVEKGVIAEETAARFRGHYLKRSYETKNPLQALQNFFANSTEQQKVFMRGKHKVISEGEYQLFLKTGKLGKFEGKVGKFTDGDVEITPRPDGRYEIRQDYSMAEREQMGEVRDIFQTIPDTIFYQKNLLAYADTFRDVAKNSKLASKAEIAGWKRGESSMGVLKDMWIEPDTFKALKGEMKYIDATQNIAAKAFKKYLSLWKMGKTVYNPVAHFNNFMGNQALLFGEGYNNPIGMSYRAWGDLGKLNKVLDLQAKELTGKLSAFERKTLNDLLKQEEVQTALLARKMGVFGRGQIVDLTGAQFGGAVKSTRGYVGKALDYAQEMYQKEDNAARLALFSDLIKGEKWDAKTKGFKKWTADEAANYVLDLFPDYTRPMSAAAKLGRDSGFTPFISWTYHTLPAIMRQLKVWERTPNGKSRGSRALAALAIGGGVLAAGGVNPLDLTDSDKLPTGYRWGQRLPFPGGQMWLKVDRLVPQYGASIGIFNSIRELGNMGVWGSALGLKSNYNFYFDSPITYRKGKCPSLSPYPSKLALS